MEEEIWKQCGESDKCFYEVSDMGRVKSISKVNKKERILKGMLKKGNYLFVRVPESISIHSLVLKIFKHNRPDGMEIDHIDRNSQNNRYDNLRYCTKSENMRNRDSFRTDILEQDSKERDKIIRQERQIERYNTKINCPCGSITNKGKISRHEKTDKHKKYVESLL